MESISSFVLPWLCSAVVLYLSSFSGSKGSKCVNALYISNPSSFVLLSKSCNLQINKTKL